jgi:alkyl hydroperoxide reductase subunit AhpC
VSRPATSGSTPPDRTVADVYGMFHLNANDTATVRSVFVIGPDIVIIIPAVSDAEAAERFPDGWRTLKPCLRMVPQPQ